MTSLSLPFRKPVENCRIPFYSGFTTIGLNGEAPIRFETNSFPNTLRSMLRCPNCHELVYPIYKHSVGWSSYHGEQDCYSQTCPNCKYSDEGDWKSSDAYCNIEDKELYISQTT